MSQEGTLDSFGYRLVVVGRRWRQLADALLESQGLSAATWRPLLYLLNFPEPPRQCDLARAMDMAKSALVRLIDKLEARKLVERVGDAADRRMKHVRLTAEGLRVARRVKKTLGDVEAHVMKGIDAREVACCNAVFERLEREIAAFPLPSGAGHLEDLR